jgi:hypothetical protein
MQLIVDLNSESFVSNSYNSPTNYVFPVTSFSARRHEVFPVSLQFASAGAITDLPYTPQIIISLKPWMNYASAPIASVYGLTKAGSGSSAVWNGTLALNTTAIETLFANNGGTEASSVPAMLEVAWSSTGSYSPAVNSISQAVSFTIANCVYNSSADTLPGAGTTTPAPVTSASVTISAPGSTPAVTVTQTGSASAFNFSIPLNPAPTLSVGTTTTGAAGTSAASSLTGTATNPILNLTLPAGQNGTSPTLSAGTVTMLAAGSSASASLSGTYPSQALNFSLPLGSPTTISSTAPSTGTISVTFPTSPVDGQLVIWRISQGATAYAITFPSTNFSLSGLTAPTATASKKFSILAGYNSATTKWEALSLTPYA